MVDILQSSPLCVKTGGGLTINMEMIDSHHFTVHMICQLPIINPGGGAENYEAPLSPCEAWGCNQYYLKLEG